MMEELPEVQVTAPRLVSRPVVPWPALLAGVGLGLALLALLRR